MARTCLGNRPDSECFRLGSARARCLRLGSQAVGVMVAFWVAIGWLGGEPQDGEELFVAAETSLGVLFEHVNGGSGHWLLPEITGSGAAVFDFDNDHDLDLYFVQSGSLEADSRYSDRLYRNDRGRFVDVTEASGIDASGYGMGVAIGDYDGDGWRDLYVTNLGPNQLWRNRDKRPAASSSRSGRLH